MIQIKTLPLATFFKPTAGLIMSCIIIGLSVTIAITVVSEYHGSTIENLVRLSDAENTLMKQNDQTTDSSIAHALSLVPLLLLWAGVGAVVYWLSSAIVGFIASGRRLREEMSYVHTDPNVLLKQSLVKIALRSGVLLFWIAVMFLTTHLIVPYIVLLIAAGRNSELLLLLACYAAAFFVTGVFWYIHTVCARLFFWRDRLFG